MNDQDGSVAGGAAPAQAGWPDKGQWTNPQYGGRLIEISADESEDRYVFAWPNHGHISRYSREAMEDSVVKASRNLVMSIVLFPPKGELEARFQEKPGLPIALANEINKQTGLTQKFTPKP